MSPAFVFITFFFFFIVILVCKIINRRCFAEDCVSEAVLLF